MSMSPRGAVDTFQPADRAERRSERRHAVRLCARLVFNYQLSVIDIRILDISRNGCQLRLSDPIPLSRTFLIAFPDIGVERPAWLAWQQERLAGVRFLDRMPPAFLGLLPPDNTP